MDTTLSSTADWEQRQKHASFFQTQLGSAQQAAIGSQTSATLLLTMGLALSKFSGVGPGQDWSVVFVSALGWLVLGGLLTSGFSKSACRIRNTYLAEHAQLFPDALPYRLESYLLDFADNLPARFSRSANEPVAAGHPAASPPTAQA